MDLLSRIIGIIITTFVLAAIYGIFCVTIDVMGDHFDPVASGRKAADNIYGLFGTVSEEAHRNDANAKPENNPPPVARKIAAPYAVTADVAAILGGKLEIAISSVFGKAEAKTHTAAKTNSSVQPAAATTSAVH